MSALNDSKEYRHTSYDALDMKETTGFLKSANIYPLTIVFKTVQATCIKDGCIPPFLSYRSQASSVGKLDV